MAHQLLISKRVTFVLVLALFLLIPTIQAFACSCSSPDIKTSFDSAETIFVGNVKAIEETGKTNSFGEKNIIVTFEVINNFKGNSLGEIKLNTILNQMSCDGYWFKNQEKYLVYAYLTDEGTLSTSFCKGTKLFSEESTETLQLKELNQND